MNNSSFPRPAETNPTTETITATRVTTYNRVEDVPTAITNLLDVAYSAQQLVERQLLARTRDASDVKRHGWGVFSTTVIQHGKKLYLADRQADLAISVDPHHVGGIRFSAQLLGSTTNYKAGRSGHQMNETASQALTCTVQPARPGEPEFIQVDVLGFINPSDAENRLPSGEQPALTTADLTTINQLSGSITRLASQYVGDFIVEPALLLTREAMDARSAGLPPTIVR